MVFSVILVGVEKELSDAQPVLNACKKYVGPMKIVTAHKAHEAVAQIQALASACGRLDVALLSHHFTAPGKEQFSDALRNVLKDKHPDTPVICYGSPSKGGKKGEHYTHALEDLDPASLGDMLARIKSGEIVAEYKDKKGRKSMDSNDARRKSTDSNETAHHRKSMDRSAAPLTAAPSLRRKSVDAMQPMQPGSPAGRRSLSLWDDGMGGASMAVSDHMPGLASMSGMNRMGGMNANVMSPMGGLNSMGSMQRGGAGMSPMRGASMTPMTGMGAGGMAPMMSMGSMGHANGMTPMTSMGSMTHGSAMSGMSGMANMGSMNAGMGAMMGMSAMGGGMNPMVGMGAANGMASAVGMGMAPMTGMGSGGGMAPMNGMGSGGGMMPMTGMGAMNGTMQPLAYTQQGSLTFQPAAPAPAAAVLAAPAPAAAAAAPAGALDVSSLLASLGTTANGSNGTSNGNADLVHMLAEEVVRLRRALEEKRRQSVDINNNNQVLGIPALRAQ